MCLFLSFSFFLTFIHRFLFEHSHRQNYNAYTRKKTRERQGKERERGEQETDEPVR